MDSTRYKSSKLAGFSDDRFKYFFFFFRIFDFVIFSPPRTSVDPQDPAKIGIAIIYNVSFKTDQVTVLYNFTQLVSSNG